MVKCPCCGHEWVDESKAKAGKARWEGKSPEERSQAARKAASARWKGKSRQCAGNCKHDVPKGAVCPGEASEIYLQRVAPGAYRVYLHATGLFLGIVRKRTEGFWSDARWAIDGDALRLTAGGPGGKVQKYRGYPTALEAGLRALSNYKADIIAERV